MYTQQILEPNSRAEIHHDSTTHLLLLSVSCHSLSHYKGNLFIHHQLIVLLLWRRGEGGGGESREGEEGKEGGERRRGKGERRRGKGERRRRGERREMDEKLHHISLPVTIFPYLSLH